MDRQRSYRGRPGRRLLSILLALVLMFTSSIPASADIFGVLAFISKRVISASGTEFEVKVTYSPGVLPAGCELEVREISKDSEEYQSYLSAAGDIVDGRVTDAGFMDIGIYKDGVAVEPDGEVKVEIKRVDGSVPEGSVSVVHFEERSVPVLSEINEETIPEVTVSSQETLEEADMALAGAETVSEETSASQEEAASLEETIITPKLIQNETDEEKVTFTTDSFSVYGVIYTVDFHWQVDGKEFEYSIPGGGYIKLSALLEILKVAEEGTPRQEEPEEENLEGTNLLDNQNTEGDLDFNSVVISEATQKLLAEVESVTFSDPSLVWVEKVDEECTIKQIKEKHDLEVQYSGELSAEQKAEIDNTVIEAGEWLLISLFPFSSEEDLIITMKDEEQFVIKITDASELASDEGFINTKIDTSYAYIIGYEEEIEVNNGGNVETTVVYHVLKTDGSMETIEDFSEFDYLGNAYRWHFNYIFKEKDREAGIDNVYYFIRPIDDNARTLALNNTGEDLVQRGTNNVAVHPQSGEGFILEGYNGEGGNGIMLYYNNPEGDEDDSFIASDTASSIIKIFKQIPLPEYTFDVETDSMTMGLVTGINSENQAVNSSGVQKFTTITNSDENNDNPKTNLYDIVAIATPNTANESNPKYIFDHWELDNVEIEIPGQVVNDTKVPTRVTIPAGNLEVPYNNSVLEAVFINNPNYTYNKDEKQGRTVDTTSYTKLSAELEEEILPLKEAGCNKTAEVYDYENRIYRIDLTAEANLVTFAGDIDLAFILDVSASMKYPSKLIEANSNEADAKYHFFNDQDEQDVIEIRTINDKYYTTNWAGQQVEDGKVWEHLGFKTTNEYYIISDEPQTATVYKLFYKTNYIDKSGNSYTGWFCIDSSKDPDEGYSNSNRKRKNVEYLSSSCTFKAKQYTVDGVVDNVRSYDYNYHYQIYVDGDPGKQRRDYLEQSLNGAAKELTKIRKLLSNTTGGTADLDFKIAWNTFANYITSQRQYTFSSVTDTAFSLTYDDAKFPGGTSTDIALLDAAGVLRSDVAEYPDYYETASADGYGTWDITDDNQTYTDMSIDSPGYNQNTAKGFKWTTTDSRYAVLITDGAPQRGGKSIDFELIRKAAKQLKDHGVTLITIGLSMDNVDGGSELLFDIATMDEDDNFPLFYSAKSGDELETILNKIIRGIIDDAIVVGTMRDKISEAFYPVDRVSGRPLANNDYIDIRGNFLKNASEGSLTDAQKAAGYGKVIKLQDGTFQIEWAEQNIYCRENGWTGTVYVKAKEDLLGGNGLYTNDGNATFDAVGYKMSASDATYLEFKEILDSTSNALQTRHVEKESPRVNVNELTFTGNDTTWTVYIGSEVNPSEQVKKLLEEALVLEVVTAGDDTDSDGFPDTLASSGKHYYRYYDSTTEKYVYQPLSNSIEDDREYGTAKEQIDAKQKIKLVKLLTELIKDLRDSGDNSEDWNSLIDNNEINWEEFVNLAMRKNVSVVDGKEIVDYGFVIPYNVYGLTDDSNIKISITNCNLMGEEQNLLVWDETKNEYVSHKTTVVNGTGEDDDGNVVSIPVEHYNLSIIYSPDYDELPKGQGGKESNGSFHTGTNGTMYQGHAAGTETSSNNHEINSYAVPIDVIKTDEESNPLQGAEFKIYRVAKEGETVDNTITLYTSELTDENGYYCIATAVSDGNGLARLAIGTTATNSNSSANINPGTTSVNLLVPGETYYLVETLPPTEIEEGEVIEYERDHSVRIVKVETQTGKYTNLLGNTIQEATYPYNWDQGARILVDNSPVVTVVKTGDELTDGTFVSQSALTSFKTAVENKPKYVKINVEKTWEDTNNPPDSIQFELYRTVYIEHKWDEGNVTNDPTCSTVGHIVYTCQNEGCNETITREIPVNPDAHKPDNPVQENYRPETCVSEGSYDMVTYCKECHTELNRVTYTIPINPNAHRAGVPVHVVIDATCDQTGYSADITYCEHCGAELGRDNETVIPARGHDWGEWIIDREPNWFRSGSAYRICKRDSSHIQYGTIPAIGSVNNALICYKLMMTHDEPFGSQGYVYFNRDLLDWERLPVGAVVHMFWYSPESSMKVYSYRDYHVWYSLLYNQVETLYGEWNGSSYTYDVSFTVTSDMERYAVSGIQKWPGSVTCTIDYSNIIQVDGSGTLSANLRTYKSMTLEQPARILLAKETTNRSPAHTALTDNNNMNIDTESPASRSSASTLTAAELSILLNSFEDKGATSPQCGKTVKEKVNQTFTITKGEDGKYKWVSENLDRFDSAGREYTYYAVETEPSSGYETTYTIPTSGMHDGDTATINNKLSSITIALHKYRKNTDIPLEGVTFTLTMVDEDGKTIQGTTISTSSTDANGKIRFDGLKAGRYKLDETGVPDGYVKSEGFYYINVTGNDSDTIEGSHNLISVSSNHVYRVENEPGAELPATGGPGTLIFYTIGAILTLLSAIMLSMKRKAA